MSVNTPYYSDPAVLFADFQKGDFGAFKYIFEIHNQSLTSFLLRLVKDQDLTDDILSESFIKCWDRRAKFDSLNGIRYFLFSIVRNSAINHLKQIARRSSKKDDIISFQLSHAMEGETEEIRAELLQEVMLEVKALPPKMKRVFELVYFDQKSYDQIAAELDISVHTAKAQRSAAVLKIRRNLSQKGIFRIWMF